MSLLDPTNPEPVIIYHAADLDGKSSAAIALRAILATQRSYRHQPQLLPMDYGWPKPPITDFHAGAAVYLLDLSFDPAYMLALAKHCRLIWIDHHTPRIQECTAAGVLDHCAHTSLSDHQPAACLLTWRHFRGLESTVPEAIAFLNQWDSAPDADRNGEDWEELVRPFQFGLRSRDADPRDAIWDDLLEMAEEAEDPDPVDTTILDGHAIIRHLHRAAADLIPRQAYPLQLHLPRIQVGDPSDEPREHTPMLAILWNQHPADPLDLHHHPDSPSADILITWAYEGHTGLWRLSLSPGPKSPHLDCGRIAQTVWQGGGHPGRAGATCAKLPQELLPYPAYCP
jgi:hypothetical protein